MSGRDFGAPASWTSDEKRALALATLTAAATAGVTALVNWGVGELQRLLAARRAASSAPANESRSA